MHPRRPAYLHSTVDATLAAFEERWRDGLARMPLADLEDEAEYTTRRLAETEQADSLCEERVSKFSWRDLLSARLTWLDGELSRRRRLDQAGIRTAPRRIPAD